MKQPKALWLLACVQMWRFFSHYGMRAILLLYMVDAIRLSDTHAFGISAVFIGLVELSGILGGVIADKAIGLRKAMGLGAILSTLGYFGLIFEQGLYLALPMIVVGASLFAGNISALLGQAYLENDPRREKGFTIFYMLQNLGALLSTFLCGLIANLYGFSAGFALAAFGMIAGSATLFLGKRLLSGIGEAPIDKKPIWPMCVLTAIFVLAALGIYFQSIVLPCLPWITLGVFGVFAAKLLKSCKLAKDKVQLLLVYLGGLILFFATQDQICSSLVVFSERLADRTIGGWTVPSSVLMSVNPVIILLLGTLIAKKRFPFSIPFVLAAVSFGILAFVCLQEMHLSIFSVMGIVSLISIAELMIGPVVYSYASEVAAKGESGTVMGMLPITFSLAFLLSGQFSKMVAVSETSISIYTYGVGFGKIALIVLVSGLILQIFMKRLRVHQTANIS